MSPLHLSSPAGMACCWVWKPLPTAGKYFGQAGTWTVSTHNTRNNRSTAAEQTTSHRGFGFIHWVTQSWGVKGKLVWMPVKRSYSGFIALVKIYANIFFCRFHKVHSYARVVLQEYVHIVFSYLYFILFFIFLLFCIWSHLWRDAFIVLFCFVFLWVQTFLPTFHWQALRNVSEIVMNFYV